MGFIAALMLMYYQEVFFFFNTKKSKKFSDLTVLKLSVIFITNFHGTELSTQLTSYDNLFHMFFSQNVDLPKLSQHTQSKKRDFFFLPVVFVSCLPTILCSTQNFPKFRFFFC